MEKLCSRHLYSILIRIRNHSPTSKAYFNQKFPDIETNWLKIYTLPRKITKNAYDRVFQYKLLNNILYLNKKLFLFGKTESRLCSFCENADEDPEHLFSTCPHSIALWRSLQNALSPNIMLDDLDAKSALLGFFDADPNDLNCSNHILLLFKIYLYQRRAAKIMTLDGLLAKIHETAKLECKLAPTGTPTYEKYNAKWRPIELPPDQ
jgi:hypothetical protein